MLSVIQKREKFSHRNTFLWVACFYCRSVQLLREQVYNEGPSESNPSQHRVLLASPDSSLGVSQAGCCV